MDSIGVMQHLKDFWKSPYMNFWFYMTLVCKNDKFFNDWFQRFGVDMDYEWNINKMNKNSSILQLTVFVLPVCLSVSLLLQCSGRSAGPVRGNRVRSAHHHTAVTSSYIIINYIWGVTPRHTGTMDDVTPRGQVLIIIQKLHSPSNTRQ